MINELFIYKEASDGTLYKILHDKLSIERDLHMVSRYILIPWVKDGNGNPLMSKSDEIDAMNEPYLVKERLKERWKPIVINYSTEKKFVDENGAPVQYVQENPDAPLPEGVFHELGYWQDVLLAAVPGITKGSQWVYAMMQNAWNATSM